jgi:hypothetical protein
MSDITLDKLNSIENSIVEFGSKFTILLQKIQSQLNGETNGGIVENDLDLNLDEILKYLLYIKEEMHKQIDEVYKETNLSHLAKVMNDFQEQFVNLNYVASNFKKG